jgi:Leucine-rich repeat (LRR) protein
MKLRLSNNNLTKLDGLNLQGMVTLDSLDLSQNKISKINVAKQLPSSLYELDLHSNSILGDLDLSQLSQLIKLDLRGNQIKTLTLSERTKQLTLIAPTGIYEGIGFQTVSATEAVFTKLTLKTHEGKLPNKFLFYYMQQDATNTTVQITEESVKNWPNLFDNLAVKKENLEKSKNDLDSQRL